MKLRRSKPEDQNFRALQFLELVIKLESKNMNNERLKSVELEQQKNEEVLFFDPEKEVNFLERIDEERRYVALGEELKTAIQEVFFVQGGSLERVLEEGRLKDPKTNCFIDSFVVDSPVEAGAFDKIQKGLTSGKKLSVHFSPVNTELGYNFNVVDFWINREGDKGVKFLRFCVKDNFEKLKNIYKTFGGREEVQSANDLLGNPLLTNDFKMADFIRNLTAEDSRVETNKERIDEVVDRLMDNFYDNFGEDLFSRKELINRIFSGIYDVILNDRLIDEVEINNYLYRRVESYMFAPFEMMTRNGGGACPGIIATAEFSLGRGMIVFSDGGSLTFKEGDIDGLNFCDQCNCYYSGDKCPLCG